MFGTFERKYVFTAQINTCTAIHIGAATENFEPHGVDSTVIKDKNNLPFIPGSSLKGVLRSYLERILYSKDKNVCMVPKLCSEKFNNKKSRDEIKSKNNNDQELTSKAIYEQLCPICHLFGSNVNAAKFMIRDAKVVEESFMGYEYRAGVVIDRDRNKAKDKGLYDLEVVPADTLFEFKAILENPDEEDLKNALFLLKAMENGSIHIGGLTSRGLGDFIIENVKVQYIDSSNIFDTYLKNDANIMDLDTLISNCFNKGEK